MAGPTIRGGAPPKPEREKFSEWAEDSDFHAVKRIARAHYSTPRRCLWALFFVACLTFLVWQVADRVIYYFSYPHITKVDMAFTHKLDFPTVTICNLNKYRRSALTDLDIHHVGHLIELVDKNGVMQYEEAYPAAWAQWVKSLDRASLQEKAKTAAWDFREFTQRVGNKAEDTILHCRWKDTDCSPVNFTTVLTHFGNCFQFRDADTKHISQKSGTGNGLKIYLYVDEVDYLHFEGADDVGFKVQVHEYNDPAFVQELGFGIQPGLHYFVELSEQRITSLGAPWGQCMDSADAHLRYFPAYSVSACRIECETRLLYNACQCVLPESPSKPSNTAGTEEEPLPVCSPDEYEYCAVNALMHTVADRKQCVCQNPCQETQYEHTLSSVKIRDTTFDHLLLKSNTTLTKAQLRGNVAVVNIFFRELSYETFEQFEAYNWISLLSDIGGQMGLFVGASFLTIIHVAEFLGMWIFSAWRCRRADGDADRVHGFSNRSESRDHLANDASPLGRRRRNTVGSAGGRRHAKLDTSRLFQTERTSTLMRDIDASIAEDYPSKLY